MELNNVNNDKTLNFIFYYNLCYNSGRCSYRQFLKKINHVPSGLKFFVITTTTGMVLVFELYQGAKTTFEDRSLGLGLAVLHLSKNNTQRISIIFR